VSRGRICEDIPLMKRSMNLRIVSHRLSAGTTSSSGASRVLKVPVLNAMPGLSSNSMVLQQSENTDIPSGFAGCESEGSRIIPEIPSVDSY
jgi:hypothetical protein